MGKFLGVDVVREDVGAASSPPRVCVIVSAMVLLNVISWLFEPMEMLWETKVVMNVVTSGCEALSLLLLLLLSLLLLLLLPPPDAV